jgi:hypothetical protein
MKRLLFVGLCLVFGVTLSAHAEVISVTATRTTYNATLDQVILRIHSITGDDVPVDSPVNLLLGTWTANGGAFNLPPVTPPAWAARLTNDGNLQDTDGGNADGLSPGVGPTTPQTWLNFSTKTADTVYRSGFVSGSLWNQFYAGYNISAAAMAAYALGPVDRTPGGGDGSEGYWFDNTLLAVLYVSKATTMAAGEDIFTGMGAYATLPGYGGYAATTVHIVPEPSSLALLCCGLLGLLAYMRRKRQ